MVIRRASGRKIRAQDAACFAAAGEAALAAGWGYAVVSGWRPQVVTTLDTLSAQRRPLDDRLELQPAMLATVAEGPRSFAESAAATPCPALARAHLLHLLWHRQLGVDLAVPLGDRSMIWQAEGGRS